MKMTFRLEYVRCGKAGCTRCPHGPYWYGYRRAGGRLVKKYLGRMDPRPGERPADPAWGIFCRATADEPLARQILGVSDLACMDVCAKAYARQLAELPGDGEGEEWRRQLLAAAWEFLRARCGW